MSNTFEEFWELYPRRVGKGAARLKFKKACQRDNARSIMDGLKRYNITCSGTEIKFIPHPATWLHQDRWQDEEVKEEEIEAPHPDLELFCQIINAKYKKSQRARGVYAKLEDITEGKRIVNDWLKSTNMSKWDRNVYLGNFISNMHTGTKVQSFMHWEARLKGKSNG